MLGKIEGKRRRRGEAKKAEMIREHHQLKGHELEQTPGDSGGQGSLVCCSPGVTKSQTRLSDSTTTMKSPM